MLLTSLLPLCALLAPILALHLPRASQTTSASPSLTTLNATQWVLSNGDNFNMTLNAKGYAYSIIWNGLELARNTTGGYSDSNAGKVVFNFTAGPEVVSQTSDMLHVAFPGYYTTIHYILFSGLSGHYQYVINNNLGEQGEVRSLYRLDPNLFTHGKTPCRDAELPKVQRIQTGYKVQDETWLQRDGSYVTKYDFSCFQRETAWHGVYGDGVGAWVVSPGLDYIRGDHLAQELMVHRESSTNHAVLLHMTHGTHFTTTFSNNISTSKMFGPWLFYINDGSLSDAASRSSYEESQWPYTWTNNSAYEDRGSVAGRLVLSDGRAASGAAVFLGDEDGSETGDQGVYYQYTTYAEDDGSFRFNHVRREKGYRLIAWANGGSIGDVVGLHNGTMVSWTDNNSTNGSSGSNKDDTLDLGEITWQLPPRTKTLWQIGTFDKKTTGFKLGGNMYGPYQNGVSDGAPENLVFSIGEDQDCDWYFAQTGQGNWTVLFDAIPADLLNNTASSGSGNVTATLSLSFAGWSSGTFSDPADLGPVLALNVSMNSQLVGEGYSSNDKALYRSATTSGGWQMLQVDVPASVFNTDRFNRLDLTLTRNERWRGIMWDALKLEWN